MVALKLASPAEAEADCSAALKLDPAYLKAWQRRSAARKQLGKFWEAAEDCEEALRCEELLLCIPSSCEGKGVLYYVHTYSALLPHRST